MDMKVGIMWEWKIGGNMLTKIPNFWFYKVEFVERKKEASYNNWAVLPL